MKTSLLSLTALLLAAAAATEYHVEARRVSAAFRRPSVFHQLAQPLHQRRRQSMWMCFSGQWAPKGKRNLAGCSYAMCLREFRLMTK